MERKVERELEVLELGELEPVPAPLEVQVELKEEEKAEGDALSSGSSERTAQ